MFHNKDLETYQNISAPADLRKRVLSSYEHKHLARQHFMHLFHKTSGVAACLVLVMVLSVFTTATFRDASVFISGTAIFPEHSVLVTPEYDVAPLRIQNTEESTTPSVAFSITLDLPRKTTISVSSGEMQLTTNDTVLSGTTFTTKGNVLVVWYANPDDSDNAFVMNLTSSSKSETLILDYDKDTDTWTLSR